jgi:uncharacterized protein (TIGR03118 family)
MKRLRIHWAGRSFEPAVKVLTTIPALLLCAGATAAAQAGHDSVPDLPPVCDRIAVAKDNHAVFHVFAVGVQIYSWSGTNWAFVAPEATLFADADHHAEVGTHFGTPTGPAWQTRSGSEVIEQRVDSCAPDSTAIPWLLLRTISETGNGVLNGVSFVQRVNTVGGIAPSTAGSSVGEEQRVPYTAEYFFYRSTANRYREADLVSDLPLVAQIQDTNLVNAWGITFSGTGPFWVSDNAAGKATLYAVTNVPNGEDTVTKQALEVTIPGGAPTGVTPGIKGGFNGDAFLFATLNGIIAGWRAPLGTTAEILASRPGAVYTGLTMATNSNGSLLLAANFTEGTLDAYGTNNNFVGQFTDADAPADYAPFNVQSIGGVVFVMFAKRGDAQGEESAGPGRGLIDVLDTETGSFHRFATGTDAGGNLHQINAPWGVTLAPLTFGQHAGELLVGNFGDGTIMTFKADGEFRGLLKSDQGGPVRIESLWGLSFGNDGRAGSADTFFFGAGPLDESHGLFGSLKPAGEKHSLGN